MFIEKISKHDLLKPLQIVTGIVERKQTQPILSNILIEKINNKIHFTSTDLDIQITTEICFDEPVSQDDAFTVGGKKILEIFRILPDQSSVSLEIKENRVQIKSGKSRFNLHTLPFQDFPKLTEQSEEFAKTIKISQIEFKKLLLSVSYSMAQQDVRYYLNGILLVVENNLLIAVATDGHRLAYNSIEINYLNNKQEVIIPRKTVLELLKLLADCDDLIEIIFLPQQIKIIFSGITMITKIIEGKFPDYKRVIPNYSNHLHLERNLIQHALQRTAILSNEKLRGIRFVLTEKNLSIVSNNSELEEAQEDIETDYHGGALDIGFNVNYLIEGVNNMSGSIVTFSFGDPNSSILITTSGNQNFKYIVMPMRI